MIFKVANCVEGKQSWVFIGDVVEVMTGHAFLRRPKPDKENGNWLDVFADPTSDEKMGDIRTQRHKEFLPQFVYDGLRNEKKPFTQVSTVLLLLRNGIHLSVVFWEAYLLNDEGKTIERL